MFKRVPATAGILVVLTLTACDKPDQVTGLSAYGASANHTGGPDLSDPSRKIYSFPDYPGSALWKVPGNPTCEDLGLVGMKIPFGGLAVAGTRPLTALIGGQLITVGTVTVTTSDGKTWNWTSTIGIDVAISKGGVNEHGGHVYVYDPDRYSDNGLSSNTTSNNAIQDISHVNFCFDLDLDSKVRADVSAKRRWDWTVDKSTDATGLIALNKNETRTVSYTVTATPGPAIDFDWRVDGTVEIRNEFPLPIAFTNVSVLVNNAPADAVSCPSMPGDPAGVYSVPPNMTIICLYNKALTSAAPVEVKFSAMPIIPPPPLPPSLYSISGSTTNVQFMDPADYTLVNRTATMMDSFNNGPSTHVLTSDALNGPFQTSYRRELPASDVCRIHKYPNKVHLQAGEHAASDVVVVDVKVIGCVGVAVIANPTWDRKYTWDLTKSADQQDVTANKDSDVTVNYVVTATPTAAAVNHAVSGTVKVTNLAEYDATPDIVMPAGTAACTSLLLAPGAATTCNYTLPTVNLGGGTVTASASVEGSNSVSGSATYDFTAPPANVLGDDITVTDAFDGGAAGDLFSANASAGVASHSYRRTLPTARCDITSYPNVATLKAAETNQEARAEWTVKLKVIGCIGISISINPGTFDRTYSWSISKTVSDQAVETTSGQDPVNVMYTVTVTPTYADGNFQLTGSVTVKNEASYPAIINVTGVVACDTPLLAAGATHTCSFALTPTGSVDGSVSASATVESSNPVTASASYVFGLPVIIGGTATVHDQFGTSGEVLLGTLNRVGETFTYGKLFGGDVCGTTQHVNTARFAAAGSPTPSGNATATVSHTISGCVVSTGCTLTQGYWKTHSASGPAKHPDATWTLLPNAEHTLFYLSGKSWLDVFRTAPAGNAYYILAHQFMAAKLNRLNNASAPADVQSILAQAEIWFTNNVPNPSGGKWRGKSATEVTAWAAVLDAYNNGYGPGHCDQNPTP